MKLPRSTPYAEKRQRVDNVSFLLTPPGCLGECFLKWRYPEIIYLNGISPDKRTIFGYLHLWKHPGVFAGDSIAALISTSPPSVTLGDTGDPAAPAQQVSEHSDST